MKKVFSISIIPCLITSCVIIDYMQTIHIVNKTNDTLLIGVAQHKIVDSVYRFLWGGIRDTTQINPFAEPKKELPFLIQKYHIINPDSDAIYASSSLFGDKEQNKIFFFIIRLQTAKNYSWQEICTNKELYDTLFITREMLKHGNVFEYW